MSEEPSPRRITGVGPTQNLMAVGTPYSDTRSSRSAIKTELAGKLHFDDPRVFSRLGLEEVPTTFVTLCLKTFNSANEDAIAQLQRLSNAADGKTMEQLEPLFPLEDQDGEDNPRKKREEVKMYPHLVRISIYFKMRH